MLLPQTHVSTLLQLLIQRYFAQLTSVLIVHDGRLDDGNSGLQQEYLEAVQLAFRNLSQQGRVIGLQWIDVSQVDRNGRSSGGSIRQEDSHDNNNNNDNFKSKNSDGDDDILSYDDALELHLLRAVDIVTEGFITILPDTVRFLHARYYATRNADLRLKDKFYLFLCEHENPGDLLATEILQFYPHHLMVTPELRTERQTNKQKATMVRRKRYPNRQTSARSTLPGIATPPSRPHQHLNFQLWTQKYVGSEGNLDALLLDSFLTNETFVRNAELYPNKVHDLKGRTIRVGTVTYIPFVVSNYVPPGTGNVDSLNATAFSNPVSFVGSEAEVMLTFCKLRNCHLRVEPYGADNWGYIYENESSVGMLGDLYTQDVEVAIGCIYNWYNDIFEVSFTIARSSVSILGPAPALFPAWRANIIPFSGSVWLFIMSTIVLCSVIMYLIRLSILNNWHENSRRNFSHRTGFEQAILDMFAVFIQQPSGPKGLQTFAARFLLSTILCATITLENTYSGQLKSILTVPLFTEAVDSIEKWSKTDWKWAAPSVIWAQSIDSSDIEKEQKMFKKFEVRDYAFLYNASFRSDYGLGIEGLMSGSYTFGKYISVPALETKIVTKDNVYFDWTVAVSTRGWPLMPLFNKHVRTVVETGLFLHWERQSAARFLDRKTQKILMNSASGHINKLPPQKLTLENISGAAFSLLFGCLIASSVFALELIVYNMNKLKMLGNNETIRRR